MAAEAEPEATERRVFIGWMRGVEEDMVDGPAARRCLRDGLSEGPVPSLETVTLRLFCGP